MVTRFEMVKHETIQTYNHKQINILFLQKINAIQSSISTNKFVGFLLCVLKDKIEYVWLQTAFKCK